MCGVLCKQGESLHRVHFCSPLDIRVVPEAEGSPATVQSLAGLCGFGLQRGSIGSTRGAAQIGQGTAGCAW